MVEGGGAVKSLARQKARPLGNLIFARAGFGGGGGLNGRCMSASGGCERAGALAGLAQPGDGDLRSTRGAIGANTVPARCTGQALSASFPACVRRGASWASAEGQRRAPARRRRSGFRVYGAGRDLVLVFKASRPRWIRGAKMRPALPHTCAAGGRAVARSPAASGCASEPGAPLIDAGRPFVGVARRGGRFASEKRYSPIAAREEVLHSRVVAGFKTTQNAANLRCREAPPGA